MLGGLTAVAPPAHATATSTEAQMAREIVADINRERAARGLSQLAYDASGAAGAQRVAEHDRDTPCHSCHSGAQPAGEVVYWAYNYPSGGATNWWMHSDPHRNLLMSPGATKIGIGVACNTAKNEYDAAGWVDAPSEAATSPNPVVTKTTQGSQCGSGSTTNTAARPSATTATSTAAAASVRTTATAAAEASPRGSTTSTARRAAARPAKGSGGAARDGDAVAAPAAGARVIFGQRAAARRAAATPAAGQGVGPAGTLLLVLTFSGALLVGLVGKRRA